MRHDHPNAVLSASNYSGEPYRISGKLESMSGWNGVVTITINEKEVIKKQLPLFSNTVDAQGDLEEKKSSFHWTGAKDDSRINLEIGRNVHPCIGSGRKIWSMPRFRRECWYPSLGTWLLIAAWFCVNSPQQITGRIIEWCGEARHFTHQQRLTLEVATLLGGDVSTAAIAKVPFDPAPRSLPAIPVAAALDKADFALTSLPHLEMPVSRKILFWGVNIAIPPARPRVPPSEPPRMS